MGKRRGHGNKVLIAFMNKCDMGRISSNAYVLVFKLSLVILEFTPKVKVLRRLKEGPQYEL